MAHFIISGECGGSWYLYRDVDGWKLITHPVGEKISETTIPQEIAWRIFTKGIDQETARMQVSIKGDTDVGQHILSMLAIVG